LEAEEEGHGCTVAEGAAEFDSLGLPDTTPLGVKVDVLVGAKGEPVGVDEDEKHAVTVGVCVTVEDEEVVPVTVAVLDGEPPAEKVRDRVPVLLEDSDPELDAVAQPDTVAVAEEKLRLTVAAAVSDCESDALGVSVEAALAVGVEEEEAEPVVAALSEALTVEVKTSAVPEMALVSEMLTMRLDEAEGVTVPIDTVADAVALEVKVAAVAETLPDEDGETEMPGDSVPTGVAVALPLAAADTVDEADASAVVVGTKEGLDAMLCVRRLVCEGKPVVSDEADAVADAVPASVFVSEAVLSGVELADALADEVGDPDSDGDTVPVAHGVADTVAEGVGCATVPVAAPEAEREPPPPPPPPRPESEADCVAVALTEEVPPLGEAEPGAGEAVPARGEGEAEVVAVAVAGAEGVPKPVGEADSVAARAGVAVPPPAAPGEWLMVEDTEKDGVGVAEKDGEDDPELLKLPVAPRANDADAVVDCEDEIVGETLRSAVAEAQEEADTVADESGVTDDEPVLVPVVEKLVVPAELNVCVCVAVREPIALALSAGDAVTSPETVPVGTGEADCVEDADSEGDEDTVPVASPVVVEDGDDVAVAVAEAVAVAVGVLLTVPEPSTTVADGGIDAKAVKEPTLDCEDDDVEVMVVV
jgi:hypothetical protein